MADKIELFGRIYAPNKRAVIDSLFSPGRTDNGVYKLKPNGVLLFDLTGAPRAFVHRDGFIVTAHKSNGRTRYMFGLSDGDKSFLCAPDSYMEECRGAKALIEAIAK